MSKNFIIGIVSVGVIAILLVFAGMYKSYVQNVNTQAEHSEYSTNGTEQTEKTPNAPSDERVTSPETPQTPPGKIKADVFTGKLESVNTGCFADGECSVEVGGKHVTVLMGWSQDTVGTVQGVPSFGDLESHIGETVEVYARVNADGTYSLYGSEGFYVKLATPITGKPKTNSECKVGGCSGQLCTDSANGEVVTTCEYRAEYACYKTARCERQTSGQCGWTETTELKQCINDSKQKAPLFEVQ